jgi:hypothetical protein
MIIGTFDMRIKQYGHLPLNYECNFTWIFRYSLVGIRSERTLQGKHFGCLFTLYIKHTKDTNI